MNDTDTLRVDLERKKNTFRGAFSELPIHYHLNSAYRDTGMYWCVPPRSLMWKVPALFVPNRVLLFVKAGPVIDEVRKKLHEAQVLVEEMRPALDRQVVRTVDRSYGNLPSDLVKAYRSSSGTAALSYEYNPYQVAAWMFREYNRFIDEMVRSRKTPFTKLSRICQKAKALQEMTDMVAHAMR